MSDEEKKCPQGWDQKQLLAYVERDMDKSALEALEAHLKSCGICASEVESLRKMDLLLKRHSDAFHPDEQRLYRYVTAGHDPEGKVARHLERCENCQEDAQLLKEMIDARSEASVRIPGMPQSLLRRIERLHPAAASESALERLYLMAEKLISAPFRMPKLALGTAAALVVLATISIPLWHAFKTVPSPGVTVAVQESRSQKPKEATHSGTRQYPQDMEKDKLMEKPERFKAEKRSGIGAPVSPAPVMGFARERKLEKSEHRSVGRVSPKLETPPSSIPATPTMKEKAHRPTAGAGPQAEREGLALPRESRPAAPAHRLKRQAAQRRHPAAVEEARREVAGSPASVSSMRVPVRIRIVDSQGRSVPGFKFRLPASLSSRYSLQEGPENKTVALVLIRVEKRDGLFDLSANFFEPNSSRASRTLQASGVPEKDLHDRITSLISALLEKK